MNTFFTPQVLIPILVSLVSVTFGIYQYFDKRKIERKSASLQLAANELALKEKQYNLKADLIIFYVDTSLASIFSYEGVLFMIRQQPMDAPVFDERMLAWVEGLGKSLPFKTHVFIVKNHKYNELMLYCSDPDQLPPEEHKIMAMLIRNEGKYPASSIELAFEKFDIDGSIQEELSQEQSSLHIDIIQPGEAALILLSHATKDKKMGIELSPFHKMSYYDNMLQKRCEMNVRIPYEVPRMVDKGLLIRG